LNAGQEATAITMPQKTLTTASILMCPHGGTVEIISSYPTVSACQNPIATIGDTFLIKSCPNVIMTGIPMPCLIVKWIASDTVVKVNGNPTLSETSSGLCLNIAQIPQGSVMIQETQSVLGTQ
jgi:uncharacterized Zn-binding protein involved in type VI secretion